MAKKPEILHEPRIVHYNSSHWALLAELRDRAIELMKHLDEAGIHSVVYGSLARGDVSQTSDIDIIIPYNLPSYRLELVIRKGIERKIVQATPSSVLKGHISLENDIVVSFPLFKMMSRESEFYRWGGQADLSQLRDNVRVPGVDKRLLLIDPTESGHIESGVISYEHEVAKKVGVSIDIALERVRVLTRRDKVGRTGVYTSITLSPEESFEVVARNLRDSDPALRRTIERREGRG